MNRALPDLLRWTLADPRSAARALMALDLPVSTGWTALVLMAVLSATLGFIGLMIAPVDMDPAMQALLGSPLRTAALQCVALALTGVLAFWVGQRFGGTGHLSQALVLVAWAQLPPLLLQLAQLAAILIAPALAPLIGLTGFALYAVILSLFIAELHGFRSGPLVFLGLLIVGFLVALIAAFLFAAVFGVPAYV